MQACWRCGYAENRSSARRCSKCGAYLVRTGHAPRLTPGDVIQGRYIVVRRLTEGGMGTIYLVKDQKLFDVLRVLKRLSPPPASEVEFPHRPELFEREAQLLASLDHPCLPKVYDYFHLHDTPCLVMDYIHGRTLEDLLREHGMPFSEEQVVIWAAQLCDVLDYLHHHVPPVLFRDMKPANIMVSPGDKVKLIDFGIARFFGYGAEAQDTVAMGTEGYAPEEQYGGRSTPQSDIYALGVTLLELLTGHDPSQSPLDLPDAREINKDVSVHVNDVIARALRPRPEERFASAVEMREALLAHPVPSGIRPGTSVLPWPLGGRLESPSLPVSCTPEEAGNRVLRETHRGVVRGMAETALEEGSIAGKLVAVVGYWRTDLTATVCEAWRAVLRRSRGRHVLARLDLSVESRREDAEFIRAILEELRRNRGPLDWRLKRRIERAYRQYRRGRVGARPAPGERRMRLLLPFELALKFPPLAEVSIGGKTQPLEWERAQWTAEAVGQSGCIRAVDMEELLSVLRDLVNYLSEKGVGVTLVLDGVSDLGILRLLGGIDTVAGVTTIVVAEAEQFKSWPAEEQARFQRTFYVPCLWDVGTQLCRVLTGGRPERERDTTRMLAAYLDYKARGSVHAAVNTLTARFYLDPVENPADPVQWIKRVLRSGGPVLCMPTEYAEAVASRGGLQTVVEARRWSTVFGHRRGGGSLLAGLEPRTLDGAVLGVYKMLDWIVRHAEQGEPFLLRELCAFAHECAIPFGESNRRLIASNLMSLLRSSGMVRETSRGFDAARILQRPGGEEGAAKRTEAVGRL